jgi:hypothetical protein
MNSLDMITTRVASKGYRMEFNNGKDVNPSASSNHFHVLGEKGVHFEGHKPLQTLGSLHNPSVKESRGKVASSFIARYQCTRPNLKRGKEGN